MYIKIKVLVIEHFHLHANYLTTALVAHGMIMGYLMYHLLKAYQVCEDI